MVLRAFKRGDFTAQSGYGLFVNWTFFFRRAFFFLPCDLYFLSRPLFGRSVRSLFVFLGFSLSGFPGATFGLIFPAAHFDPQTDLSILVSDQQMAAEMKASGYRNAPRDERDHGEDHYRAG